MDRQLIDRSLLMDSEMEWFNSYHKSASHHPEGIEYL
ncbi:M24 family metallopeptidase C-terminal domain-containing protein [Aequorivita capsosiphonis]